MNKVIIYGRLGSEPELNNTKSGSAVLKFRVATNERQKRGDEWVDHTEWHAVVVWGKRAESLSRLLHKGSAVLVEGNLRTSSWEKDGQKRSRTEISALDVTLGAKGEGEWQKPAAKPANDSAIFDDADDMPF